MKLFKTLHFFFQLWLQFCYIYSIDFTRSYVFLNAWIETVLYDYKAFQSILGIAVAFSPLEWRMTVYNYILLLPHTYYHCWDNGGTQTHCPLLDHPVTFNNLY